MMATGATNRCPPRLLPPAMPKSGYSRISVGVGKQLVMNGLFIMVFVRFATARPERGFWIAGLNLITMKVAKAIH